MTGPATVIAVDAATFGVSVLALARLRVPQVAPAVTSPWRDLADGWAQFRAPARPARPSVMMGEQTWCGRAPRDGGGAR